MKRSFGARRKHLQEIVGATGRVSAPGMGTEAQRFQVFCRVCLEPVPWSPKVLRKTMIIESELASEAAAEWLAHEATGEHRINVERDSRR